MVTPDGKVLFPLRSLKGSRCVPGDKSISHRSLLFAAVADGPSHISHLAPGQDVQSTRKALERLGVPIIEREGTVSVEGLGWSGLDRDENAAPIELDCGNSGTTARLLCGLLAGRRGAYRLVGDSSLSSRPMRRVREPLEALGARIEGGDTLPLLLRGTHLHAGRVRTPVASAQVKSALILAALQADGVSTIEEDHLTRDHTERLLLSMGAPIEHTGNGAATIGVRGGEPRLSPIRFRVPGDPSSAAYLAALGCLLPGSEVVLPGVSLNPTRLGFYRLLRRMGARLSWEETEQSPEPTGTIRANGGRLQGIDVGPEDVVAAIDEIPLLAIIASQADGTTRIRGAEELRHKESDRISTTVAMLEAFGAEVEELEDGMEIHGGVSLRGCTVSSSGDHRLAMCAAVAAAVADRPSLLIGHEWVKVSYPGFFDELREHPRG